jgi:hypothetical protein
LLTSTVGEVEMTVIAIDVGARRGITEATPKRGIGSEGGKMRSHPLPNQPLLKTNSNYVLLFL